MPRLFRALPVSLLSALLALSACAPAPVTPPTPPKAVAAPPSGDPAATVVERRPSPLTPDERKMAEIAWKYFENNHQPATGFCNAVDQYPSTTLWDTGSYMVGMVAAFEFGIIERHEFDKRMIQLLGALNRIELFRGELPNKVYHTQTLQQVDYGNQPGEIGFSALDLGRLLIWLRIVKERYPWHTVAVDNVVLRWDFSNVVDEWGTLFGALIDEQGRTQYVQEGRLGYEEYAAKGFRLWGFDTTRASKYEPYAVIPLYGLDIPYDTRDPRQLVAHNYVVAESYVLDALELNWDQPEDRVSGDDVHTDPQMAEFARRIFAVQAARHADTGILTARTEHQLDQAPYFVYDTIYTDGYAWNTISEKGEHLPQFAAVALKGAIGMWGVWDMPYAQTLMDGVGHLYDPEKGFYEGVYENGTGLINTFTANNNGIILETLLYKTQGKLLRFGPQRETPWDKSVRECPPDAYKRAQCPRPRKAKSR